MPRKPKVQRTPDREVADCVGRTEERQCRRDVPQVRDCSHAVLPWKDEVEEGAPHLTPPMTTTDKGQKRRTLTFHLVQKIVRSLHAEPAHGLRNAKFATSMRLAMRITQALHRPAADFVYVAEW